VCCSVLQCVVARIYNIKCRWSVSSKRALQIQGDFLQEPSYLLDNSPTCVGLFCTRRPLLQKSPTNTRRFSTGAFESFGKEPYVCRPPLQKRLSFVGLSFHKEPYKRCSLLQRSPTCAKELYIRRALSQKIQSLQTYVAYI